MGLPVLGSAQDTSTAVPVMPEIISTFPNVRDFTISKAGDEAYFTAQDLSGKLSIIIGAFKTNGGWNEQQIMPFSGTHADLEPFLSPDGLRLFFVSNRPVHSEDTTKDFDIWYVERVEKGSDWSQPINVGAPINTAYDEFYPAITNSNNLYYTLAIPNSGTQDDLYVAKWDGKSYKAPVKVAGAINTNGAEYNAYVSPDESFIIFGGWRRDGNQGGGDLYLSRRSSMDLYATPQHLDAPINSDAIDYCPFVDIASNTLYFTSKRSQVGKEGMSYNTIELLYEALNQHENGASRIYKVDISSLLND